ncbi:MAG TPA: hypothetical protein VGW78_07000 [Candidatus Babeliales bacterium]|jgi:hypothetical protein|nr:hypothetical protein [Candidatus Babeliales bacterium]
MFKGLYTKSLMYFAKHPMLNSFAHSVGGFGIALLLQYYIVGDAFAPLWVGWLCITGSLVIHIRSCI